MTTITTGGLSVGLDRHCHRGGCEDRRDIGEWGGEHSGGRGDDWGRQIDGRHGEVGKNRGGGDGRSHRTIQKCD